MPRAGKATVVADNDAYNAVKKDAGRYRYVRLCAGPDPDTDDLFNVRATDKHGNESLALYFDDAIDAAMTKEKP